MALIYPTYDVAAYGLTLTTAGMTSDTNLLAGWQSNVVDNTSTNYDDFILQARATTGTSPTASRSIEWWLIGSADGSLWPDTITSAGTGQKTLTSADIKAAITVYMQTVATSATSNQAYNTRVWSAKALFGGELPPKFLVWQVHNTGVALNATAGNHYVQVQPIKRNVN
jgi:hypothetical protein